MAREAIRLLRNSTVVRLRRLRFVTSAAASELYGCKADFSVVVTLPALDISLPDVKLVSFARSVLRPRRRNELGRRSYLSMWPSDEQGGDSRTDEDDDCDDRQNERFPRHARHAP
jgi:hypothetical protein